MAITIALVESTPYLLRYLLTQDGVSTASPTTDSTSVIPNNGGASPDLRTDAAAAAAANVGGVGGSAMSQIMLARINGYGPLAAGALNQAQARALLDANNVTPTLFGGKVAVCRITLRPRTQGATGVVGGQTGAPVQWLADADVDASGDPIIRVGTARRPPAASTAYLELSLQHTLAD